MSTSDTSLLVNILLAAYNGERFIKEQLNSLYQQSYPLRQIYVRDDCSRDATLTLIAKEQSSGRLVALPSCKNLGPAASFFELLSQITEGGFFAFCDQDDVWYQDKLDRAIKALKAVPSDIPAMYFSRVECVDAQNRFIQLSPMPRKIGFGNALVENVATGCTVVMNRSGRDLVAKHLPDQCLMHDSWCYLVISCFGKVLFDEQPSMRYRQHSSNAIGAATSSWDTLFRRLKRFSLRKKGVFRFSDQAGKFLDLYGEAIAEQNKNLLLSLVNARKSFIDRIRLASNPNIWRQSALDNLILKLLILLNRY